MEKIHIKNFGGIDELEINLNKINIFIGKQASGKSITAKLIYFFKGLSREFFDGALQEKNKSQVTKTILKKFEEYFPSDAWPSRNFEITYYFNDEYAQIKKEKSKLKIDFSEAPIALFNYARRIIKSDKDQYELSGDRFEVYRPSYQINEKYMEMVQRDLGFTASYNPLFIPAGRSFFANLQSSIFSFLSNNKAIDPFLVEFGSFYENMKPMARAIHSRENKQLTALSESMVMDILGSKYHREKSKDYLIHADRRKINVSFSSSGQQETLPLIIILKALMRIGFTGKGTSVFVEEPEAHLFPTAQKKIIEFMGLVYNNSRTSTQLIITTHSPYVLTSINNLLQAGILLKENPERKELFNKIVPQESIIPAGDLSAYAFKNGTTESIVDSETGLIFSRYLDQVSEEIAMEFDNLLNVN